jgi:prophage regulatory protein
MPMDKIIREPELLKLVGLSRTTLWRREKAGDFPKRRQLSSRSVGWVLSEVLEWIEQRPLAEGGARLAAPKKVQSPQVSPQTSDSPEAIPGEGS